MTKILASTLLAAASAFAAQPATLNVVFHGLWGFSVSSNEIVAVTPDLAGKHIYTAGNWRNALPLSKGEVPILTGVTAGAAQFDPRRNLIVQAPLDRNAPAYAIHLPIPKSIASLMTVRPGFRTHAKELATLQVFTYDVADAGLLQLAGHNWEPQVIGGAVNLHVYAVPATPEIARNMQHAQLAFAARTALFHGLVLTPGHEFHPRPRLNVEELPQGLMPGEIEEAAVKAGSPRALAFVGSDACTGMADAGLVSIH